jgi:hypothetical protein
MKSSNNSSLIDKKYIFLSILLFFLNVNSQTTTWNGVSWSSGIPNSTINAVIDGNFNTSNNGVIDCKNLTLNNTSLLRIEIGDYCNVYGNITVAPTANLFVSSGGFLIPANVNAIFSGEVSVERKTPSLKRYDYTYWSSPVVTTVGNSLLETNWQSSKIFTFNTSNFLDVETTYAGTFISNLPDGQDDDGNVWTNSLLSDVMITGKGYATMVKSVPLVGIYPRTEIVVFKGFLNTGIINIPLTLSQNTASDYDDYNLIGNPYSASISSNDFIDTNINNISGVLYFWTHSNTLSSNYTGLELLNFSKNDYAKYTKLGGVRAVFGGRLPSEVVGSCQGFLVEAENQANLTFTPSMMSVAYSNTTPISFFRNNSDLEFNVRLNLYNLDFFSQQLIGYNSDTNLDYNKGWDSKIFNINVPLKFYSLEDFNLFDIQARGKFKKKDVVKLGYYSAVETQYTIEAETEGNVPDKLFLYDKLLNICHNLDAPYVFNTTIGKHEDRFELRYKKIKKDDDKEILISNEGSFFNIVSEEVKFTNVKVYDFTGTLIREMNGNWLELKIDDLPKGIYIFQINIDNKVVTKKTSNI